MIDGLKNVECVNFQKIIFVFIFVDIYQRCDFFFSDVIFNGIVVGSEYCVSISSFDRISQIILL